MPEDVKPLQSLPAAYGAMCFTPDPTGYHPASFVMPTSGVSGTVVPRAREGPGGGSLGRNPHKGPCVAVIDPFNPELGGGFTVDFRKLDQDDINQATRGGKNIADEAERSGTLAMSKFTQEIMRGLGDKAESRTGVWRSQRPVERVAPVSHEVAAPPEASRSEVRDLEPGSSPPRAQVFYDFGGRNTVPFLYHDVQDNGTHLVLTYDRRWTEGICYFPEGNEIYVYVPHLGQVYVVAEGARHAFQDWEHCALRILQRHDYEPRDD